MTQEIAYEVVGYLPNGAHKIKFTENEFQGIIFTIGKVSFEEVGEDMVMHYTYDIVEHEQELESYDKETFDKAVGDLLIQLLEEGVKSNSLIYTGGVDE